MHEERGALGGFLEAASWIEIEGETMEIAFGEKHVVFREKIEARENLEYLRRVARDVAGRDLAIRVTVATPGVVAGRSAAQGESEETRKERLRGEAERAPMVRSLLDTLGGRIVDVDPV